MDRLTRGELIEMAKNRGENCISIYLPTVRAGGETEQNRIRFKNRVEKANSQLERLGIPKSKLDKLTEPLKKLVLDSTFWQHQSQGLAAFLSDDDLRTYRLPIEFDDLTLVSDRFHLKPLLTYLHSGARFFILTLDTEGIRLYEATPFSIEPLPLTGAPDSLSEFLTWEDPEEQLQWHTATAQLDFPAGVRGAMFHGHGAGAEKEVRTEQLQRFFQSLDSAIYNMLAGDDHPPLVLIGGDKQIGHYQRVNHYPRMAAAISHNPNDVKDEELHEIAWPHIKELSDQEVARDLDRYHSLVNNGRASANLHEVLPAAAMGRVDTLFYARDRVVWGEFDLAREQIKSVENLEPGSVDLIDLAAVETLLNGGQIHSLTSDELPDESPVAAILRY